MNIRFNDKENKIIQCIEDITGVKPSIAQETEKEHLTDNRPFHIKNILLFSSSFHFFQLEEEGRLRTLFTERQMNNEQVSVPSITHVETGKECLELLKKNTYNLLILFNTFDEIDIIALTKKIRITSQIPIVVLGNSIAELAKISEKDQGKTITKLFTWNGDGKIILTIVQSIEDAANITLTPELTQQCRCVLLIEDSIQYYSTYLLLIYEEIWNAVETITQDTLNEEHRIQRLNNRPLVLHALNFEEGVKLYEKHKNKLVGIITDNQEEQQKKSRKQAGLELARNVWNEKPDLPVLIQSSEPIKRDIPLEKHIKFISKNAPNLLVVVKEFIRECLCPQ